MNVYNLAKPLLFSVPPETAHNLVMTWLAGIDGTPLERVLKQRYQVIDSRLEVETLGKTFPNPVGLAAGFDKNAEAPGALAALGFGHIELGAITAQAQEGNPRPRMFRLPQDEALINRMGFNNHGADVVGERLDAIDLPDVPVGINLGKSKTVEPEEAPADYAYTYNRVAEAGDFFVVNVSSPNTPGLRDLQNRKALESIVTRLTDEGADPLLVKLSPDLTEAATQSALEVVKEHDLDGVVAVNTTTDRPDDLDHEHSAESGGLSGAPLRSVSTDRIRFVAQRVDVPVIGVGGVASAADAYEKIRAGASVVQLYTGLVYEGPGIAKRINTGLLELLDADGFDSVEEAIGADL